MRLQWIICSLLLLAITLALATIAPQFDHIMQVSDHPLYLLVGLLITGAAIHLYAIKSASSIRTTRPLITWIIFVGLAMRIIMIFSQPILEDDYHRYLWDGAVTANAVNPYAHAPATLLDPAPPSIDSIPLALRTLAQETTARDHLQQINHGQIRTIYPPITQSIFAFTHTLNPWSLQTWRGVLLVFDLATLALIFALLKILRRPLAYAIVYWWCPLAVKEIFNSAHMDALVFPFVLGAILLAIRGRRLAATALATLGLGVKIWPIMLVPLLARSDLTKPRRLVAHVLIAALLIAPMAWWILSGRLGGDSALVIYAKSWANNSLLYQCQISICETIFTAMHWPDRFLHLPPRVLGGAIMLALLIGVTRHAWTAPSQLINRVLLLVGALLLVSPTQFPWYFVWLLPLLSLRLYWPALLYTATLPLYYYSYQYPWVLWIEHAPPLVWMTWDLARSLQRSSTER